MDPRQNQLARWCATQLDQPTISLEMVSGDASFRRYFRCHHQNQSYIVMDAPPEKEDSYSFVAIANHWFKAGLQVPQILAQDLKQGFLLLSDQGDTLLLSALLTAQTPQLSAGENYYAKAFDTLAKIQALPSPPDYPLPLYDSQLLQREMALFTDWLIGEKLQLTLSAQEQTLFDELFKLLEDNALAQDQVCVHRDFHSRNLMILDDDTLGVLDFQDAVLGPVTYDLVSLLRDCYVAWPKDAVHQWCLHYHSMALAKGLTQSDADTFKRWFDWMGMQRHLKAAGIFARLSLRDGKHGYLKDIPRTVGYLLEVAEGYPPLHTFANWLRTRMLPELKQLETGA